MKILRSPLIRQIVALSIASALGYFFGQKIEFSKQWPMFEALRTTAGIIFGVLGAWLAIIYPRAFTQQSSSETEREMIQAEKVLATKLLTPIRHSTVVLATVLTLGLLAPILQQVVWLSAYTAQLRGVAFLILTYLTLVQLWTIFLSLFPTEGVGDRLNQEVKHIAVVKEYSKQMRKASSSA